MRTKQYTVYTFDELSKRAQEKALESLYDVNVDYDWWECTADDIAAFGKASGLGCTYGKAFDLGRGDYLHITDLCTTVSELGANASKVEHDYPNVYAEVLQPFFATFTPKELRQLERLERADLLGSLSGQTRSDRQARRWEVECFNTRETPRIHTLLTRLCDAWEELVRDLERCYLGILRKEYEYLTSREAILETIKANEYEFTAAGKLTT